MAPVIKITVAKFLFATLSLLHVVAAVGFAAQTDPSIIGRWSLGPNLPFFPVHTHTLPTGRIMIWPGDAGISGDNPWQWDPGTGSMTQLALPGYNAFCSGHSFLADGRLFVAGGHIQNNVGIPTASTYDPFTNTWSYLPNMNAGRWYPTSTTLANGDPLVVSGSIDLTLGENRLPQVFQNATATWRDLTNAQIALGLYPRMHLAPNGKVFVSGMSNASRYLDTSGTGSWTFVANSSRSRDYGSSVMYDNGKVLIMGGGDPPTNSAEVIDLNAAAPAWRTVGSMAFARRQLNATILPDGTVLVTGGTSGAGFNDATNSVYAAEMWNPTTETWTTMASATIPRLYHSNVVLLPDGRLLSTGGNSYPQTEIYEPPYLFNGARPTISSAPGSVIYGQTFLIETPDAASITQATWIALSSTTHAFNMNQRFSRLSFSPATGGLNVVAPSSANLSPPGYYMLFILNGNGVPSVAKIIRIDLTTADPVLTPVLISLSPGFASAGGGPFTLTVNGSNFLNGSEVHWNGVPRTTTFVNNTQLTTAIPASDIATAGTAQISVFNPGGGTSNSLNFSIATSGCPTGQFFAEYFNNISLSGSPTFTVCQSSINYNWGSGGPGNGLANDNFSARWTGTYSFNAASYTFTATADDGIRVWLDGSLIIDSWRDQAPTTYRATRALTAGNHLVKVEYYEKAGGAVAQVSWLSTAGAAGSLQFSSPTYSVSEAGGNGSITITRAGGSSGAAGVTFATSNGSATAGSDYTAITQTVIFADGDTTSKTISVPILNDSTWEGNETIKLTLSNPTGGATIGTPGTAVLTIVDDENPVPTLGTLSPSSVAPGASAFTLTVYGTNFFSGSVVQWNGSPRTTTFVSSTQVTASIPATDVAVAGTVPVAVFNPAPAGGTSNAVNFTIAAPTTTCPTGQFFAEYFNNISLSGSPTFTACQSTINYNWGSGGPGNGLANDNFSVRWTGSFSFNAANYTFTAKSDDGIRVWLDGSLIINGWKDQAATTYQATRTLTAGDHLVKVEYYEKTGGAVAQASWLEATNPVPALNTILPSNTPPGGSGFTLTVNGSSFTSGALVQWNGSSRASTFINSTQLTAAITDSDIATAGTAQVSVFNPSPGGGTSNLLTFTIGNPPTSCPTGQYFAEYFNNISLSGAPAFTACEANINYNWGSGGPGNGLANDNFSVRWTGAFSFNAANYTFTATADDGVRVWLDGSLIIDGWKINRRPLIGLPAHLPPAIISSRSSITKKAAAPSPK